MANTYNAVVNISMYVPPTEPLSIPLITQGKGTFTVQNGKHVLEIFSGEHVNPLRVGELVQVVGLATAQHGLGAFPIHELMRCTGSLEPATFVGPILLGTQG